MFTAIEKTEEEHREHFIKLCEDKDKKIVPSNICVVIYCMIPPSKTLEAKCPSNTEEIGNFHTHPSINTGYPKPSKQDIVSNATAKTQTFCIGHAKNIPNKVENNRWIEGKKHIIDCYEIKDKRLLELGNKAHKAALTRDIRLFDELTNEMYSRLDDIEYPSKIKDIIDKKCTLTETKLFEKKIKNRHTVPSSKRLIKVTRYQHIK